LGWVVVVAPPAHGAVQMLTVQGALEQMVKGFRQRFSYPRANLVLPSRSSSDPRHDQALVRAVRYLGSHESVGVSGQLFDVELPEPPQVTEALLPEVRAALDTNVRQDDDYVYVWGAAPSNNGATGSGDDAYGGDDDSDADLAYDDGDSEVSDGYQLATDYQDGDVEDEASDDDYDDYAAFDLHWSQELGLRSGPALRHVVGDDLDGFHTEEAYAAGLEPAVDLYGDLTRLEPEGVGDVPDLDGDPDRSRTLAFGAEPDGSKKRR